MSTHAVDTRTEDPTAVKVLRNLDLGILTVALPIFIAAGWPILGWVTGAGLYVFQRMLRAFLERRAERAEDPRTTVGLLAGSMIGRGWLVAGVILTVGLVTDSETGLSAAVLFLATFTVAFTMTLAMRAGESVPPKRGAP
jgi:hypothetical protein